jgi:hypothetical protein
MNIDGSSLHSRYGAKVRQGSQTSLLDGSRSGGVRATRPRLSAPSDKSVQSEFASLVADKALKPKVSGSPVQEESTQDKTVDSSALASSLENAANYIKKEFGDDASTAFMGIVIKHSGSNVTEKSLGNALLQSVKFIDRNFGFSAGDKVMDQFNSDINKTMNDYFDNGLQEHFFAVNPNQSLGTTLQSTFSTVSEKYGQDVSDSIKSMIEQVLKEDGSNVESYKKGIGQALEEAEKTTPGITADIESMAAGELFDKIAPDNQVMQSAATASTGTILNAVA